MDAPSQTLWEHYLAFYRKYGDTTLDFDQEESCRFMNRVFRQPALKGYIVNLDEKEFKVVEDALRWVCEDDPYDAKASPCNSSPPPAKMSRTRCACCPAARNSISPTKPSSPARPAGLRKPT